MPSTPQQLPGQKWLIDFMQSKAYPSAATGVCFGVAMMAVQALLLNDIAAFDQRLWQMFLAFQNGLPTTVEMLAFIEGVELNTQPWLYAELFPSFQPLYQSSLIAMPYVQSAALELQGFEKGRPFIGAYTREELKTCFTSLLHTINTCGVNLTHPLTMMLSTADHAITVAYDAKIKEWRLIDASGKLVSEPFSQVDDLVRAVHAAFSHSPTMVMSTTLFATAENREAMHDIQSHWYNDEKMCALHTLTRDNVNVKDSNGATRLSLAALQGNLDEAVACLEAGANPDLGHPHVLPLFLAVNIDHHELVKQLLLHHANPNLAVQTKQGGLQTPLYLAVSRKNSEMVKLLLQAGADANVKNMDTGLSPLVLAAWCNDVDSIRHLLAANATVDDVSTSHSALFMAAKNGNREAVEMLLAAGANPKKSYQGLNAMDIAKYAKHAEIVQLMEDAIARKEIAIAMTPAPIFNVATENLVIKTSSTKIGFFTRFFGKKNKANNAPPLQPKQPL